MNGHPMKFFAIWLKTILMVAALGSFAVPSAFAQTGTVVAWGALSQNYGQTTIPAGLSLVANLALAQSKGNNAKLATPTPNKVVLPHGVTEEMLAPPPVPRFMLEKPGKPLTIDEMLQQVREVESRAKTQLGGARKPGNEQTQKKVD